MNSAIANFTPSVLRRIEGLAHVLINKPPKVFLQALEEGDPSVVLDVLMVELALRKLPCNEAAGGILFDYIEDIAFQKGMEQ